MFPDVYSDQAGSSVGLVLTNLVTDEERATLLTLLDQHTALKSQDLFPPDQRLGSVGSALVKGGRAGVTGDRDRGREGRGVN